MSDRERRIYERFSTTIAVDYASGETFLFASIQNISEMGIFIFSEDPLPIGSLLKLRFALADQTQLVLDGEVVWVNPVRDDGENLNPGMGVQFRGLTPEMREKVVELVRTVAYVRDLRPN